MKVVAIIQARMGSRRLPGKVLADIEDVPMLGRVVERVRAAGRVGEVWVASTTDRADDAIETWCGSAGISVHRGSEADVLGRFVEVATRADADVIVRLTADCPLLDPAVVDQVIAELLAHQPDVDYTANVLERSFPRGLDVEAFTRPALARMDELGRTVQAREHVTIPVRLEHPAAFMVRSVRSATDDSDLRWTVDTADDLGFVRLLYRTLRLGERRVPCAELVAWCRDHPTIARRDTPGHTWDPGQAIQIPTTEGA